MSLNLLIEPKNLSPACKQNNNNLIIDVSSMASYKKHHLPGAIYFDYGNLVCGEPPSPGKLPGIDQLSRSLADNGISTDKTIIAYDDEGGGKASRLLWNLDILGFNNLHLINGGLHAWAQAGLSLESTVNRADRISTQALCFDQSKIAAKTFILDNLNNSNVVIWDTRTPQEYHGITTRAQRNGHIPGAVNLNWLDTIDARNGLRYLEHEKLMKLLIDKGITPDKTIVPHCHTHHRSSHSTILLKYLGFPSVKPYPGSWSEWGNLNDTPISQ